MTAQAQEWAVKWLLWLWEFCKVRENNFLMMSFYMGSVTAPTHQVDGRPISGRLWAFVALVLVVCPAPLALVCNFLASWACWICNVACRQVQFSESVHEKRNGEVRIASKQHAEGSSYFSLIISIRHGHLEGSNWSLPLVWRVISSQTGTESAC